MTWLRVDDRADDNPLILRLSDAAYRMWSYSMIFCGRQMTNGNVPFEALNRLADGKRHKRLVAELLEVVEPYGSLWELDKERGGYQVVHYLRWNQTREDIEQAQEAAKVRKDQWMARRATRGAPDGEDDAPPFDPDARAENDVPPPPEVRTPRGSRPARRPVEAGSRRVDGARGPGTRKAPPSEPPAERAHERVPNSVQSNPLHDPDPDPDPDPRSPTGVCALDPRVPAHAGLGEHTHTTGTGEEFQLDRLGEAADADAQPGGTGPSTPATEVTAGADPDAEAILAHLRALPEPMCHLATQENASRLAGARMSGLTLEEIRTAISTAGLKLGRHRGAHPSRPESLDDLADHVGGFVANQRRLTARVAPHSPRDADPVAVERALGRWCELYKGKTSVAYTVTDEDRGYAADLLELVHQAAVQEGVRTGRDEPDFEERIVEHWLRSYLADEGPNGYLAKARHPLRYIKRQVGTYGLPRAAKLAKCPAPEPQEVPPTIEDTVAGAAQVLRVMGAGIGTGGDHVAPLPVRARKPDPR